MKIKISLVIIAALAIVIFVFYHQTSYKTLDEAIRKSFIPIDGVYYTTEIKGQTVIFYGEDENLSVGLIEKTPLNGYQWVAGVGSKQFNEGELVITRSFSNLRPRKRNTDEDLISIAYGVIGDESIGKLMIKNKGRDYTEATLIETPQGRIWFCFSEDPLNYDPEVKRVYKDGREESGWE